MALFDRENQLIQILESLSRTGNISQTASELFMTQPTVSKIIRTQEKEFNCEFIDRTAHPLKLTYAGEYYLNKIRQLAQSYQTLSHDLQTYAQDAHGHISIGVNSSLAQVVLPQLLPLFHQRFPQVGIQLRELDSTVLQQAVQNGELDVYIGVTPAYNAALAYRHLYNDAGALILPERMQPKVMPDLPIVNVAPFVNGQDFICETPESDFQRTVDGYLTKYHIAPSTVLQTPNLTTACALACAGLGATIIPHSMPLHYLKDQAVCVLPIAESAFQTAVEIAYNQERHLTSPVQAFIDLAIQHYHKISE